MNVASTTPVTLSTTSVYPESTASAFEVASTLGFDGIELMIGIDPVAIDVDAVSKLSDYHEVPVTSVHAPCLLVTQRIWSADHWERLVRSAETAKQLGADVVVVHPPFRWQSNYANTFEKGVRSLTEDTGVQFCVENMYPWRTPAGELKAYSPHWDPTYGDYDYLTLDLSHASTARKKSLDYVKEWGDRLRHVHLTDGTGSFKDEHLLPGHGDQQAAEVLRYLTAHDFTGHVVLEVNTRGAGSRAAREQQLAESLAFTREHLQQPAPQAR